MEGTEQDYKDWSHQKLIERVEILERQLKEQTEKYKTFKSSQPVPLTRHPKNARAAGEFKPSKYSTRLIALKFAYLGQAYNGLEHHAKTKTPLPTVEEVIWRALMKARLIFPTPIEGLASDEVNWEGCGYSKCGRTDKGVSAFGQVIGLRVRSTRPILQEEQRNDVEVDTTEPVPKYAAVLDDQGFTSLTREASNGSLPDSLSPKNMSDGTAPFDPISDEIPYPQVLNRLLPPDVRVLAWCPSPLKDFSARFSCKERRYKYFFTQPAFSPAIGSSDNPDTSGETDGLGSRREGWLDIEAMRAAAQSYVGLHDFRNFCKVDASKQTENFERRIFHASIDELHPDVSPMGYLNRLELAEHNFKPTRAVEIKDIPGPRIFTFTLHGSAFLWHQVRHMVAILFLIGQGLEPPSLVSDLLNVEKHPQRPQYEMADDAPLVLWDCIFPEEGSGSREDALDWIYVGDSASKENGFSKNPSGNGNGKYGLGSVLDEMWKVWRRRKIDEVLAGTLMDVVASQGNILQDAGRQHIEQANFRGSQRVWAGGDRARLVGKYIPVLSKPRMDSVEMINARYVKRKKSSGDEVQDGPTFKKPPEKLREF